MRAAGLRLDLEQSHLPRVEEREDLAVAELEEGISLKLAILEPDQERHPAPAAEFRKLAE